MFWDDLRVSRDVLGVSLGVGRVSRGVESRRKDCSGRLKEAPRSQTSLPDLSPIVPSPIRSSVRSRYLRREAG